MEMRSLSNERPIIPGIVNGKRRAFLVDTGASIGLVSEGTKGRRFNGKLVGQGGEFESAYICDDIVQFGEKKVGQFVIADISQVASSIFMETGIEIFGIIGFKQMKDIGLTINTADNTIQI